MPYNSPYVIFSAASHQILSKVSRSDRTLHLVVFIPLYLLNLSLDS